MFLGVYGHDVPPDLQVAFHGTEVCDTWLNEALHFASSYAAKSALWLIRLPK